MEATKQTATWYKTCSGQISEVVVVKELPKSRVIEYRSFGGKTFEKTVRDNSYEKYFRTYAEAKDSIIEEAKQKILEAESKLKRAQLKLSKLMNDL
jgi:hypothetical protein